MCFLNFSSESYIFVTLWLSYKNISFKFYFFGDDINNFEIKFTLLEYKFNISHKVTFKTIILFGQTCPLCSFLPVGREKREKERNLFYILMYVTVFSEQNCHKITTGKNFRLTRNWFKNRQSPHEYSVSHLSWFYRSFLNNNNKKINKWFSFLAFVLEKQYLCSANCTYNSL